MRTRVGIIGAGAMGTGIAQVFVMAGHPVTLADENENALARAKSQLKSTFQKLEEKQKITQQQAKDFFSSIDFTTELNSEKFSNQELIIEAVIERLDIKQSIFQKLENLLPSTCILASNTSSLSITSIASACKNPERVIGIHFFNPAPLMPLVEIIPGIATENSVTLKSKDLISALNKTVVLCKDTPGFIVNRIARPFYGEAMRIYEEGIADIATIDEAMRKVGGFKMGPFELTDLIGHDVNYTVTETVWKEFYFDPRFKPALCQKRLTEAKHFGRKSGKGFYNYSPEAIQPIPSSDSQLQENIFLRIICMLINEAADALHLNVANKEDIDLAMTKGVNYPKGLLRWADEIGVNRVVKLLDELNELYREDRYRASVLLRKMAKENRNFYP